MRLVVRVPAWQYRAACAGKPVSWWFPEGKGSSPDRALEVCEACPVRVECARWAITEGLDVGVFGGMSERARRAARRDAA